MRPWLFHANFVVESWLSPLGFEKYFLNKMHKTLIALGSRAVWKGPHFVPLPPTPKTEPIKTMARSSTILPSHVGRKFQVHNGKSYINVFVTELMVNHKLGEFAPTRKPFHFKKRDSK